MQTARAYNGMAVTPHGLASQAAVDILQQGGNAVEAAVAAASTLSVVYPHMTGIGGDGFWLIVPKGAKEPVYIDACGCAGHNVSHALYQNKGLSAIPKRGPLSAITVAGAVSGWEAALQCAEQWHSAGVTNAPLSLHTLLAAAIGYAENGFPVSLSQSVMTQTYLEELIGQPGFANQFLCNGNIPTVGQRMTLPALANTLKRLAQDGLQSFYQGDIAKNIAHDIKQAGGVLDTADLQHHSAHIRPALHTLFAGGEVYNCPPPTQGVASLIILALVERFFVANPCLAQNEDVLPHVIVEATKLAFCLRDEHVADDAHMKIQAASLLAPDRLDALAKQIRIDRAAPWPTPMSAGGDTIWLGVVDKFGNAVSYIQSIYHEFGSGMVLPQTGIVWQNRGLGFNFEHGKVNSLGPQKKPFHTLNPAIAIMPDGRIISYGTMGGEGQPQTQAAILCKMLLHKWDVQKAVTAPRWLLGRAWGDVSNNLKIEEDMPLAIQQLLIQNGHDVQLVPALSSLMGHAGAIVRYADGLLEGAYDPRSDGSVGYW